jgi:hypothetical protein
MATYYENIDLRNCRFVIRPTGQVKWAYTSLWRTASRPNHNGVDIGSSHYPHYETCYGWPLLAIMDGEMYYRYDSRSGYNANIQTPYGTFVYCHMIDPADTNQQNRSVKAGEIIGYTGTSGGVAAHLHFIWFQNGRDRNPQPLLDAIAASEWANHTPHPTTPTNPSDPESPSKLLESMMAGAIFSVDGGTQCYIDGGDKLHVIRSDGERSLRLLTMTNPIHPFGEWVELSSSNPQHAAACEAYYKYYAPQLKKK